MAWSGTSANFNLPYPESANAYNELRPDLVNLVDDIDSTLTSFLQTGGGSLTGNLTITAGAPTFTLNATSGNALSILRSVNNYGGFLQFRTGTSTRWELGKTATSESGANAGSDFSLSRYNDSGQLIDTPLNIDRASGATTITGNTSITGTLAVTGSISGQINASQIIAGILPILQGGTGTSTATGTGNLVLAASPTLTGTPLAPTAASDTNTTQIATTAFVQSQTWSASEITAGTLAVARGGTGVTTSTGSGNLVLSASPTLTGTPVAPTATSTDNTTQIATTAFVQSQVWDATEITTGTLPIARGGTGTTSSTGTGSLVLSASPTLTGTLTAAAVTLSGILNTTANISMSKATAELFVLSHSNTNALIRTGANAGSIAGVTYATDSSTRWLVAKNGDAESGSNAGSNLIFVSYNDAGNILGVPLALNRATSSATFGGKVITAASATGGAGLNLPHGTSPTSPTNGDVWTTTAGMYIRINGTTVGPLGTGGGGGSSTLDGLTDVDASSPSTNQFLRWSGTQWEPGSISVSVIPAGSVLNVKETGGAYTRPTARTDVTVIFTGVSDPGSVAIDGDKWDRL